MTICQWITDSAFGPYRGGRWKYRVFDLPAFMGIYFLIGAPHITDWRLWALVALSAIMTAVAKAEVEWESSGRDGS